MAYNPTAESYATGERFASVYCAITDATPCEGAWRASALIGEIPELAHLKPRTQREIIAVVLREAGRLPDGGDKIVRVRPGWYKWGFAPRG